MTNKEAYDLLKSMDKKIFTLDELHTLGIDDQNILELKQRNKLIKHVDNTLHLC